MLPSGEEGEGVEMWCMLWCMHRTNIYLTDEQCTRLDAVAQRDGTSRAAVIRRLIDEGLLASAPDLERDLRAIDDSFGIVADLDFPDRGDGDREQHLASIGGSQVTTSPARRSRRAAADR